MSFLNRAVTSNSIAYKLCLHLHLGLSIQHKRESPRFVIQHVFTHKLLLHKISGIRYMQYTNTTSKCCLNSRNTGVPRISV